MERELGSVERRGEGFCSDVRGGLLPNNTTLTLSVFGWVRREMLQFDHLFISFHIFLLIFLSSHMVTLVFISSFHSQDDVAGTRRIVSSMPFYVSPPTLQVISLFLSLSFSLIHKMKISHYPFIFLTSSFPLHPQGSWIGHTSLNMNQLRKEFFVANNLSSATLLISGIGYYEFEVESLSLSLSLSLSFSLNPLPALDLRYHQLYTNQASLSFSSLPLSLFPRR